MTLSPPIPITFAVGAALTSGQLNSQIRDALTFFLDPPAAIYRQVTAQSIPSGAWTSVTWDTIDKDNDSTFASGSPTRFTAHKAGTYQVAGYAAQSTNSTANAVYGVRLLLNGNVLSGSLETQSITGTSLQNVGSMLIMSVGDYIELQVFQQTGSSEPLPVGGATGYPRFSARWSGS